MNKGKDEEDKNVSTDQNSGLGLPSLRVLANQRGLPGPPHLKQPHSDHHHSLFLYLKFFSS